MSYICICNAGVPQMHLGDCRDYLRKVVAVLPFQLTGNDGVNNSVSLTTIPVPLLTFTGLFGQANATKRLHWLSGLKNFSSEVSDQKVKTWADDTTTKIEDGQTSITFIVPETSPLNAYALQGLECSSPGALLLTASKQLIGYADPALLATDKKLYPLPVERWAVKPSIFMTDDDVPQVEITLFFSKTLDLSWITIVNANQHSLNPLANYELKETTVLPGLTPPTTTSLTVNVARASGGILGNNTPVSGLTIADFTLFNVTDSTAITPLTMTETVAGTYDFTFVAQTSADVINVQQGVSNKVVITIP